MREGFSRTNGDTFATTFAALLRHFEGEQDPHLTNRWKGQEEGTHPSFGQFEWSSLHYLMQFRFFPRKQE